MCITKGRHPIVYPENPPQRGVASRSIEQKRDMVRNITELSDTWREAGDGSCCDEYPIKEPVDCLLI